MSTPARANHPAAFVRTHAWWAANLVWWALYSAADTLSVATSAGMILGIPVPPVEIAAIALLNTVFYSLLTYLIFALAERFPIGDAGDALRIAHYLALAFSAAVLYNVAEFALRASSFEVWVPSTTFMVHTGMTLPRRTLYVLAIVGAAHAILHARRGRAREEEKLLLQRDLLAAQMGSLRMQLNPHFLSNTLTAISSFVLTNALEARRMVSLLGRLLRIALVNSEKEKVTLQEELEFVQLYVDIMQIRMTTRLQVQWEISPRTLAIEVPYFILQPLVENAIEHGLQPKPEGGSIRVTSEFAGGRLALRVEDDGVGIVSTTPKDGGGYGLGSVRRRIEMMYGNCGTVLLHPGETRGAVATILIPAELPKEPAAPAPDRPGIAA